MTKFFLNQKANPNVVSEYGETPLHLALKRDLYGAKYPDATDCWNDPIYRIENPLDFIDLPEDEMEYSETNAIIEEHRLAVLNLLLDESSTDVNAKDIYGASPLHNVIYGNSNSPDIVKRLIERGADVSARNRQGQTPLHLACTQGNLDAVNELLSHGADVAAGDLEGVNAIHYGAQGGNVEIVQSLFIRVTSALVASRDTRGRNALHHLVRRPGHVDYAVLKSLLGEGVNVNDLDDTGMLPLAIYLQRFLLLSDDVPHVVRLFLQHGSDPKFKTRGKGLTLAHLHAHTYKVKVELLEMLEVFGVDLEVRDYESRTVLHHCAIAGSLTKEALRFLRNKGRLAEELQDAQGKTPRQYAAELRREKPHPDIFDQDRWSRTEKIFLGII